MLQNKLSQLFYNLYRYFAPQDNQLSVDSPVPVRKSGVYLGDNSMTMRFYKATGGLVVQVLSYSSSNNISSYNTISTGPQELSSLYIIEDGKAVGEELERIITITQLSK